MVALQLPDVIRIPFQQDKVYSVEALCIVLCRLSYPTRRRDMSRLFRRHTSALSRIFNYTIGCILQKVKSSVTVLPVEHQRLVEYTRAFGEKHGAPVHIIPLVAVIDVKKHQISRPSIHQKSLYSGHTRYHCLKYQTLEAPDGLILHCSASEDGRCGDGYILRCSNLENYWRHNNDLNGFMILGDSAYPNNDVIVSLYKGSNLPAQAKAFNKMFVPLCTCVEWGYAKVVNTCTLHWSHYGEWQCG